MSEKRLIDAYTFAEEIESLQITVAGKPARWNDGKHTVLYRIAEQPTIDAVEVVRCQNCIHWDDEEEVCLKIYSDGVVSPYAWQHRNADDFCSYGERKDHEHH